MGKSVQSIEIPHRFATSRHCNVILCYCSMLIRVQPNKIVLCCVGCIFGTGFSVRSVGGCIRFLCVSLRLPNCTVSVLCGFASSLVFSCALSVLATYRVEFTSLRISTFRLNGISANRNVVLNTAHIIEVLFVELFFFAISHTLKER